MFLAFYFQRIIFEDIPTKFFFDLLQETDQEFVVRTGWIYRHDQPLHVPDPCVCVRPPYLPVGSLPASHIPDVDHRQWNSEALMFMIVFRFYILLWQILVSALMGSNISELYYCKRSTTFNDS